MDTIKKAAQNVIISRWHNVSTLSALQSPALSFLNGFTECTLATYHRLYIGVALEADGWSTAPRTLAPDSHKVFAQGGASLRANVEEVGA